MVQHIQAKHQAHTRGNLLHQSLYCHEASSVNALSPCPAAYRYVLSCSESACFERSMWMFRFPNWIRHLSASQARGTKHQQNVFCGKTVPPCTFRLNNYATTHLQWTHTPSLSLLSFKASQDTELCQYHSKFLAWAVWMLFGSNHNTQMDGSSKLVSPTFTLLSGIL